MKVELNIQNIDDRDNVIKALATAGYSVHVRSEKTITYDTIYYVCFDTKKASKNTE